MIYNLKRREYTFWKEMVQAKQGDREKGKEDGTTEEPPENNIPFQLRSNNFNILQITSFLESQYTSSLIKFIQ